MNANTPVRLLRSTARRNARSSKVSAFDFFLSVVLLVVIVFVMVRHKGNSR